VSGLSAQHFAVFEEGVQQPISLFGATEVPMDVALVTDASSSMMQELPAVQDGAEALVARLRRGDRASVVAVRAQGELAAPLDADLAAVRRAIRGLYASGTTALYDGVYLSLRQFERQRRLQPERRRQALVIFSDGIDNASHVDYEEIVALARALDVTIYTITLEEETWGRVMLYDPLQPRWLMRTLSLETGGQAFFPVKSTEMRAIFDRIARELVSQYTLAYVAPPDRDGPRFRRLSVRVVPPAQGVARTRAGYTRPHAPARIVAAQSGGQ
jgi:VWFA-related protein